MPFEEKRTPQSTSLSPELTPPIASSNAGYSHHLDSPSGHPCANAGGVCLLRRSSRSGYW
eukprot:5191953-Pleurochrysis_carterae.AAC.6